MKNLVNEIPEFIIKIIDIDEEQFICEVVYNNFMVNGPPIFEMEEGEQVDLNIDDFEEFSLRELDHNPIPQIDSKINDLTMLKGFYQKLLDKHNES